MLALAQLYLSETHQFDPHGYRYINCVLTAIARDVYINVMEGPPSI